MRTLAAFMMVAILGSASATGQAQLSTIYSFSGSPDGASPVDKLVFDKAGNLYGTTESGGANGWGSVFELSPNGDGTWTESTIYSFCQQANCSDGSNPLDALILDAVGNLYGTTSTGGGSKCPPGGDGCGTVFELSPPLLPGGAWTESVLYDFCQIPGDENCMDGAKPSGKLIFDATGNLYGTASSGAGGVLFELLPGLDGWTESVLYTFCVHGDLH
ncbi:MAG: choice-of-anchor tandem repeat GloVer-containing protein, partial [Terriglobales bacterium]